MIDIEVLATQAAAGDVRALDALLTESRPIVMAHCRKILPNQLDAEEAAQDTLFAISRNIRGFAGRSKYTTWIYPICTNASIDCYRKLKRRQSVLGAMPAEPVAPGSSPSVIAGARIDVLEAAEHLADKATDLLLMRDLLEMDYAEMASITGTNESTLRWQVSQARKKMQRHLSPLNS